MKNRISARVMLLIALAALSLLGASASSPIINPANQTVTLALLGDISLARGVEPNATSFSVLASQLDSADLVLANLESPLNPHCVPPEQNPTETSYNLCASAEHAPWLKAWGFDLLSLANNHALDCGAEGLAFTQSALEAIHLSGIGPPIPNETDSSALYRHVNGLDLAFLAFDDVTQPMDMEAATAEVQSAKNQGALVIVSMHWGAEYQAGPSPRQKEIATALAQAGALLIWGHHPHVLQPSQWLQTENGSTLVFYSLGNALFDSYGLADINRSALILVKLDGHDIVDVEAVPFVIDAINSRVVLANLPEHQQILSRLKFH